MFKRGGYIDELVAYIKKNLKKGYTQESLKWALINQGYSKLEVERTMKRVNEELANQVPELNIRPIIKYEFVEPKQKVKYTHHTPQKKESFFRKIFKKSKSF